MRHLLLLLSLALMAASTCKKEPAIGRGFALEQPLQLKAEPAESSPAGTILPRGSEFELISRSVADTNGNGTWLKIRAGKQVGFMRPDAAEDNNRPAVILMLDSATAEKYVTNQQVHVLAQPLQKSAIIATLSSEANVEGVSHSLLSTQIEGVQAHWVGVKTGEQKVGYVFGGYLDKVATQAEGSGANTSTQHVDGQSIGYAMIISETPTFRPGSNEWPNQPPEDELKSILKRLKWPPAKGQIVHVRNMKKQGKKTMYEIYGQVDSEDLFGVVFTQTLWVSDSDVEFFTNFFQYTLKMNPTIPTEMVDFLSREAPYLDARTIKIERLKLMKVADPEIRFFLITGKAGAIAGLGTDQLLIMQRGTKLQLLEKIIAPNAAMVVDIDGDGAAEFIFSYHQVRSGAVHDWVYAYEPGKGFIPLLHLGSHYSYNIEPPLLVIECNSEEPGPAFGPDAQCLGLWEKPLLPMQLIHAFELKANNFFEVPLPAKYQKRDAELRAGKGH